MSLREKIKSDGKPVVYTIITGLVYFAVLSNWNTTEAIFYALHFAILQAGIVSVNTRILLNKFQYNTLAYQLRSISLLAILIGLSITAQFLAVEYLLNSRPIGSDKPIPILLIIFIHSLALGIPLFISTLIHVIRQERNQREQIYSLEKLQTETELKFLKSQINPHFLFNALNNIYTFSYTGNKSAPDKILMLSDMLRYVLYDCNNENVPLYRELDYLNSYIEFQQLKTEQTQNISFKIENISEGIQIAPMILIPFIENSIKHSKIGVDKTAWISGSISIINNKLRFLMKNSVPEIPSQNWLNSEGGIGLSNVKKRLELLYPQKHVIDINDNQKEYGIDLRINLD